MTKPKYTSPRDALALVPPDRLAECAGAWVTLSAARRNHAAATRAGKTTLPIVYDEGIERYLLLCLIPRPEK